jgi:hypothetical protein
MVAIKHFGSSNLRAIERYSNPAAANQATALLKRRTDAEIRMKSMDFISYKFSTYMRGQQEWVTGLEGGKIFTADYWGLSSGGQTVVEGPPFNYYNYQGDVQHGHIPVDISRELYEAVK